MQRIIKKYIVLIILGLFTVVLVLKNIIDGHKINESGIYVLARIKSYDFSARGTTYYYEFWYKKNKYTGSTLAVGWNKRVGDLILLKTNHSNPKIYDVVSLKVPFCLSLKLQPINGWEEMPKDTCK